MDMCTEITADVAVRPIELTLTPALERAAKSLVFNKYLIDKAADGQGGAMLAGDLHDNGYGPAEPLPFLCRVLPFMREEELEHDHIYALVPTAHTLGCSWKWRGRSLGESQARDLLTRLSDVKALTEGHLNEASYAWIEPLGLFAPMEGKNRADFFRERQVDHIPARVSKYSYPSPDRIKLYRIASQGFDQTWAVLDEQWLQVVAHPNWATPMLQAYGVEVAEWPRQFPAPMDVLLSLFNRRDSIPMSSSRESRDGTSLDLSALRARGDYLSGTVPCSLLDLGEVTVDPRFWWWAVSGALVGLGLLVLAFEPTHALSVVAMLLVGTTFSAGLMPALAPIIKAPRRALRNPGVPPRG